MLSPSILLAPLASAAACLVTSARLAAEPAPGNERPALASRPEGCDASSDAFDGEDREHVARNPLHGFDARVTASGVEVRGQGTHDWRLALRTRAIGACAATPAELVLDGARAELVRAQGVEWFVNDARGLEQGWTLDALPELDADGRFTIEVGVSGLEACVSGDALAVEFGDERGRRVARWTGLRAWDATGRDLAARFEVAPSGVVLVVDARDARAPIVVDPVLEGPAWIGEPDQAGAAYGTSVASAGDVNGDGFDDVVVGAPNFDGASNDEGRVFVYLGSAAGLAPAPAWTADGGQAGARFGASVSGGDVNGDGFADLLVGAPGWSNGEAAEGRVVVYLGSATGLGAIPWWTTEADQAAAHLGAAVAWVGDVNGDGFGDVLVGAPDWDGQHLDEGKVLQLRGSVFGLAVPVNWSAVGDENGAGLGTSVAAAGDVNGDGYPDMLMGAPRRYGTGLVRLAGGGPGPTNWGWDFFSAQVAIALGTSVAGPGDVNGDGFDEVLVGAPNLDFGGTDAGRAFLWRGSSGGVVTGSVWSSDGGQSFAHCGASVAGAGDVDGDGYADLLVGTPDFDSPNANEGRVAFYRGAATFPSTAPSWTWFGGQVGAQLGACVSSAGDVNGDGAADVVLGAPGFSNGEADEGRVLVFTGRRWRDCNGNGVHDAEDIAAGASADLNADGVPDECEVAGTPVCAGDGSGAACPCGNTSPAGAGRGCLNSFLVGARLDALGTASVAADSLTLYGVDMPPVASAIYLQGDSAVAGGAGTPVGDGLRCVNGSIVRLGTRTNVGGASSFGAANPGDPRVSARGGVPAAGGTYVYQIWYRNAAAYCTSETFNFSNGLRVVWTP